MPLDTAPNPNPEGQRKILPFLYETHRKYARMARIYTSMYYSTRVLAGLCAVLVPFIINSKPPIATVLSIIVAVCLAIDTIFKPLESLTIYSDATDQLAIEEAKYLGDYEAYKNLWDIVKATEATKRRNLTELKTVLEDLRKTGNQ